MFNSNLRKDIGVYDNNFKALTLERDSIKKEAIAYKFSVEQLEYLNDSIIDNLNDMRVKLNIKENQLLQMQNIKTEVTIRDSVFFKDTVFKTSFVKIDTIISDNWHSLAISLNKNKLNIETKYKSDLCVFAKNSREILGTPKKCAVGRWFQKKHNVIRVEVIDRNPYSVIKEQKFVIIE
jgi:hypothetical protein